MFNMYLAAHYICHDCVSLSLSLSLSLSVFKSMRQPRIHQVSLDVMRLSALIDGYADTQS